MENTTVSSFSYQDIVGLSNVITYLCCPYKLFEDKDKHNYNETKAFITEMPSENQDKKNSLDS
jgi:hypothetical protein